MLQADERRIAQRGFPGRLLRAVAVGFVIAGCLRAPLAQVVPLTIIDAAPLAFGRFAAGAGGSVTISPGGVRTASGGVVLLSAGNGSPAQFTVSGDPGAVVSISLPADGAVVLTSDSGHTMPVRAFSSTPSGAAQLSAGGSRTVSVGATLGVAPGQRVGSYSGHFQLILNYN